jgi:hypothetical protein
MQRIASFKPSPSMAIALLALLVALGGTSYAALKLPSNSVGTKQLKKRAVTRAKLAAGAVDDTKVRAGSLTGKSINAATLGKVPTAGTADNATTAGHAANADNAANATNATTAANATNATTAAAANALASVNYAVDTSAGAITVPACRADPCTAADVGSTPAIALCPNGTVAISGGGAGEDPGVELTGSFPTFMFGSGVPNAWEVDVDNWAQSTSRVDYFAVCTAVKNPTGL